MSNPEEIAKMFDKPYSQFARKVHRPQAAEAGAEFIQKPYSHANYAHNYPPELTDHHEEIRQALANGTFLVDLRKRYKVSRYLFECYVNEMPDLKQARNDALEDLLDEHEKNLHGISLNPDVDADAKMLGVQLNGTKFFLERRGQTRGYGAKLETNEIGGIRVPLVILPGLTDEEIEATESEIAKNTEEALRENPAQE